MGRIVAQIGNRPYLDSNAWIYSIERVLPLHVQSDAVFVASDCAELTVFSSEPTVAEVLVRPLKMADAALTRAYQAVLQTTGNRLIVTVSRDVLCAASQICANHGIKLPDAIHIATAELSGCSSIVTNDRQFVGKSTLPVVLLSSITL